MQASFATLIAELNYQIFQCFTTEGVQAKMSVKKIGKKQCSTIPAFYREASVPLVVGPPSLRSGKNKVIFSETRPCQSVFTVLT